MPCHRGVFDMVSDLVVDIYCLMPTCERKRGEPEIDWISVFVYSRFHFGGGRPGVRRLAVSILTSVLMSHTVGSVGWLVSGQSRTGGQGQRSK